MFPDAILIFTFTVIGKGEPMRQWKFSTQRVSEDISTSPYTVDIVDYNVPIVENGICKVQGRPDSLTVVIYRGGNIQSRVDIPHNIIERLLKMRLDIEQTSEV